MHHIGVGGDEVGVHRPAIFGRNACYAVAFGMDIGDFSVQAQLPANILEQTDKPLDKRASAALGKPHPAFTLKRVNKGVDGTGRKGVAAHE